MNEGNQGRVRLYGDLALKTYHNRDEISSKDWYRYEVENLRKITQYRGRLEIFQLPQLLDCDDTTLTITMTAVDLDRPYIVDLSPMIRRRSVFDLFMAEVFEDFVIRQHPDASSGSVRSLRVALTRLADECEIFYTDPKPSNVRLEKSR